MQAKKVATLTQCRLHCKQGSPEDLPVSDPNLATSTGNVVGKRVHCQSLRQSAIDGTISFWPGVFTAAFCFSINLLQTHFPDLLSILKEVQQCELLFESLRSVAGWAGPETATTEKGCLAKLKCTLDTAPLYFGISLQYYSSAIGLIA